MALFSEQKSLLALFVGIGVFVGFTFVLPMLAPDTFSVNYHQGGVVATGDNSAVVSLSGASSLAASSTPVFVPHYIETPVAVKGIYMTSWVAGTSRLRNKLVTLLDTTEANAVVIDVKDYSGRISFVVHDPELIKVGLQ